jgi:uncharacterized protein (TIGR04255 family)
MSEPVRFSNPPVTELVFDVSFRLPRRMQTAHVGAFWSTIRHDFPFASDKAPVPPMQTPPRPGQAVEIANIEFSEVPPLRRTWFEDTEQRELIQLQDDRFIYNWRRKGLNDPYLGYDEIHPLFERRLIELQNFLGEVGLGAMDYVGFELTYVNQIGPLNGLGSVALHAALVDHVRDEARERFLPRPQVATTVSIYALPEDGGVLRVQSQGTATSLRMDLAARTDATGRDDIYRRKWFDLAHTWIIRGFKDATSSEFHSTHWGAIS